MSSLWTPSGEHRPEEEPSSAAPTGAGTPADQGAPEMDAEAYEELIDRPRWLFANGPNGTHAETVDGFIDVAVESLAAHEKYLSVFDPATPVEQQARIQVDRATMPRPDLDGHRIVEFIQLACGS